MNVTFATIPKTGHKQGRGSAFRHSPGSQEYVWKRRFIFCVLTEEAGQSGIDPVSMEVTGIPLELNMTVLIEHI